MPDKVPIESKLLTAGFDSYKIYITKLYSIWVSTSFNTLQFYQNNSDNSGKPQREYQRIRKSDPRFPSFEIYTWNQYPGESVVCQDVLYRVFQWENGLDALKIEASNLSPNSSCPKYAYFIRKELTPH